MLNRCSPRFMTCMVTGNGNPSPSCPLIFPVAMYPTIAISPRATVPATRGRADIPSEKKSLGSSGSYFGWTAMRCDDKHELTGQMRLVDVFDPDGNRIQLTEEIA